MTKKMIAVAVASLFAVSPINAQGPAGADAAKAGATGGVSTGAVVAVVAVVAVAVAASSGGGGAFAPAPSSQPTTAANATATTAAATQATAAANAATAVNTSAAAVAGGQINTSVENARIASVAGAAAATAAAAAAITAASDAQVASGFPVVGVVNGSRTICVAAASCTALEIRNLNFAAAQAARNAAEAASRSRNLLAELIDTIARVAPGVDLTAARAQLVIATTAALESRVQANNAIGQYVSVLAQLGVTGTTLASLITGTTGPSGTR